jgi:hypothetical protein
MTRRNHRQRSRNRAKLARWRGVRLQVPGRTPRLPWTRPLRRLRRAIRSSQGLIDSTRRVIETSEELGAVRPVRTSRDLQRAAAWLADALRRLGRVPEGLREVSDCILLAPELAGGVPAMLLEATSHWISAASAVDEASDELEQLGEQLLELMKSGAVVPEREWRSVHYRLRVKVVPRVDPIRAFLRVRRSSALDRISSIPVRRRRTAPTAVADAPRTISRGRAPPFLSSSLHPQL